MLKYLIMKRGFTLLEIILVIAFTCAIFFPLLQVMVSNLHGSREVERSYGALNMAQAELELLRGLPINQVTGSTKQVVPGQTIFSKSVLVSQEATGLIRVGVTLYWNMPGGEQNITISTFIASGESQ